MQRLACRPSCLDAWPFSDVPACYSLVHVICRRLNGSGDRSLLCALMLVYACLFRYSAFLQTGMTAMRVHDLRLL